LLEKYIRGSNNQMEWQGMVHLANHAGIGILKIRGNQTYYRGWAIRFSGATYFGINLYDNKPKYTLPNLKLIEKNRIGYF
jgi:hypothetical protein